MKKSLAAILLLCSVSISAQHVALNMEFSQYSGDYLGLPLPDTIPQKFAPGFISVYGQYNHCLAFSPDGNQLVYTWAASDWSDYGMNYSRKIGNKWLKPVTLKYQGSEKVAMNPIFSEDSDKIIFAAVATDWPDTDIYSLDLYDSGYATKAQPLNTPVNSPFLDFGYFRDKDGTIYFSGKRDDFAGGAFDIYTCQDVAGKEVIKNLRQLNSALDETSPYISPDGSYMVFDQMVNDQNLAYNDSTARIIQIQLFASFRDVRGTWSAPVNLGSPVNAKEARTYRPVISPDGKFLFYTKTGNGNSTADVYWVSTKIIDKLKQNKK